MKEAAVQKHRSDVGKRARALRTQNKVRCNRIFHKEGPIIIPDDKYFLIINETIDHNQDNGHDGEK